jgi:hypothetical protein
MALGPVGGDIHREAGKWLRAEEVGELLANI